MSSMYIRSQDREKLYRLGGNYACVEYGSATERAKKGQEPKETHSIFISDGVLEEIGTYETKERFNFIFDIDRIYAEHEDEVEELLWR